MDEEHIKFDFPPLPRTAASETMEKFSREAFEARLSMLQKVFKIALGLNCGVKYWIWFEGTTLKMRAQPSRDIPAGTIEEYEGAPPT